ncbi:MAG: glycoside hydrolase family 30 beta sandwich domain-containing protein [Bryobacteraceae bacterium]
MRWTAAGMAAVAAVPAQGAPAGDIHVRLTAGAKRYAEEPPLPWQAAAGPSMGAIVLDPRTTHQEVLGFGAAFTDAACYTLKRLPPAAREGLLRELFHPSEMGLSVCRTCIGSSDYSTSVYSFDDGVADPQLRRFSIMHDLVDILPMLRQARQVNPGLFLFSSPWSPPGWMKAGGSMLGGSMRKSSFAVYARYLVKFLQAYQAEGVAIDAITSQNEVDTDQDGKMPACLWGQEYEIEFVAKHLGPEFARNSLATKIWILDHNYDLWGRALCTLDAPGVGQYVDGVAWHGYGGKPEAMTRVHEAHPDKHAYWTEGGPDVTDPAYLTDWTKWSATFAGILRNWARCIVGWNLALDEKGWPNIGPFPCGGLVTIHSQTQEILRSGQYWAFAHYSRAIRRGARRIGSEGVIEKVSHAAFANPDGSTALVLTNAGAERKVRLELAGRMAEVALPADSVATLTWS